MGGETQRKSQRSRARTWVLVGALCGLLSWVPALAPHLYFELLGYRIGRPLRWLLPSWWAIRGAEVLGSRSFDPVWLHIALLVAAGVLLGASVALGLWWVVGQVRFAARRS